MYNIHLKNRYGEFPFPADLKPRHTTKPAPQMLLET